MFNNIPSAELSIYAVLCKSIVTSSTSSISVEKAFSTDIEDVEEVTIDLHKTAYMDSSALGMLLNMQKLLSGKVSTFKITNTRPQVLKILQIARFDKKFEIS